MKIKFIVAAAFLILCASAAERVPWTSSRVLGSPEKPYKYQLERRFPHVNFTNAIDFTFSRELERWLLGDQSGKLFSFGSQGQKLSLAADLAELMGREGSFYALTLDPNFRSNRFIYICYAQKPELKEGSRVSRFKVSSSPEPKIDLASEEVLITWLSGGHNGCCLKFGKDGFLYISTGDAAGPNPPDPLKTGQDITDLLSSVLRIDVHNKSEGKNYRVPVDNPFIETPNARPEIWAYGFRNPWRMAFDEKTGDLWVGDVGWEMWELVYKVQRGGNYGWSIVEGRQPVLPNDPRGPTSILPPIKDHPHNEAASITGGVVYYGKKFPELTGSFIYGDWETGKAWALRAAGEKIEFFQELCDSTTRHIAFAEDAHGEVFVLDYNGGVYELVENKNPHSPQDFPRKLSETGLFSSVEKLVPADGVYRFDVNAAMWNDFGVAERIVALPGESSINTSEALWRFPSNAVLARTISLEMERGNSATAKRIETQLLHFTGDGWGAYTYRWNDQQSDAELVPADGADELLKVKDAEQPGGIRLQPWRFASRTECLRCHNTWCGTALAFQPEQLGQQLSDFLDVKVIGALRQSKPQLVSPYHHSEDLDRRARSYLHVNCSQCHREAAGGSVPSVFNYDLPLEKTRSVNARPILGDLGLQNGKVISPGAPFSSVLLFRTSATGRSRMPYLASELVDDDGVALLREWIASLDQKTSEPKLAEVKSELTSAPHSIPAKYFANSSSALLLAHAFTDSSIAPQTKEQIANAAAKSSNPLVTELFERFLPADARTNVLQSIARPEEVLALRGDAKRGATLLNDTARLTCLQCHQFGAGGRAFGPNLAEAGRKKTRAELLDSILHPSREIAPEYVLYSIELTDDELLSGIIVHRNANELILRDPTGTDHTVPSSKIKSNRPQQLSAMPEGLLSGLAAQEVADLLEAIARGL
ncbi:MAG TPA: PQQ-dependent sugar dehydrogenase [Verrucomicrobiae bacterium]